MEGSSLEALEQLLVPATPFLGAIAQPSPFLPLLFLFVLLFSQAYFCLATTVSLGGFVKEKVVGT